VGVLGVEVPVCYWWVRAWDLVLRLLEGKGSVSLLGGGGRAEGVTRGALEFERLVHRRKVHLRFLPMVHLPALPAGLPGLLQEQAAEVEWGLLVL